jgi:hypothetical protein
MRGLDRKDRHCMYSFLAGTFQITDAIAKGGNAFTEVVPPLVEASDEVAKFRPFISGELHDSTKG